MDVLSPGAESTGDYSRSRAKLAIELVLALWWDPLTQVHAVLLGMRWTSSPPSDAKVLLWTEE